MQRIDSDLVRQCTLCEDLPLGPKPIFQFDVRAKILIAGQAPGRRTHERGMPFDDASGERLREWLGIERATFYDATQLAILPMGFCYPGSGKSGDLPPRPECAVQWRNALLEQLQTLELTLVIGCYALDWHLGKQQRENLTATVKAWQSYAPTRIPLPHPSPRNNRWLKQNPWFEQEVVPYVQQRIADILMSDLH